ncbi:helix-turn-helix protein [Posidoniimonas corsicana]|uniref:Helix-turn-helix protein n=1 Tax=Posidoniimonas corsicana TaxID=1938618 RepID=A0A5C5VDD8_9BACT|nr:HigA family addiction module antitoxin [Posidoniimonas corsicana]TWT36634.1 helix-turn-helix protein [Posidoniimonas corsicana]
MDTFVPAEPIPPGEYLQDELDARGWTHEDLSEVTGITRRQIANIVKGKSGVTPESAKAIAAAFDQEPATWMNFQVAFELANAAVEEREIRKLARLHEMLPIREMRRRNWLPKKCSTEKLEDAVCSFLEIGDLSERPKLCVAARKSDDYTFNNPAQLAWYYRIKKVAPAAPVEGKYSDSNWAPGVEDLLKLAANAEDARRVPRVLADMGIRFVLLQHIQRSKIDGVAMWLDDDSPVVGLSLRYDRLDNFWFSLLHELVHIKHKHASPVDEEIGPKEGLDDIEVTANSEASATLVAPEKLESFIRRCGPGFQMTRVVQFARSQGIHPHIVAGQLRHRDVIKHYQLTKLNEKVASHIKGQALTEGWGDFIALEH